MLYYNSIDKVKELILLKVIKVKNAWFATTSFLIMDSDFKILYAMVVMISQWTMLCLSISDIAIITIKNIDYCDIIHNISKFEAINLLESAVLEVVGIYKKSS